LRRTATLRRRTTRAADIATAEKKDFSPGGTLSIRLTAKDSDLGWKFRADGIRNGRGDVRSRRMTSAILNSRKSIGLAIPIVVQPAGGSR
jgi:type II secretory pathway component PulJ